MNKNKVGALASCALLALGVAACGKSSSSSSSASPSSATISGAGSTFAAPVYQQWGSSSGMTVNYQPVGSGAGITALEGKTVDFGASDPPLKPADIATLEKVGPVQQLPMFLGAITVSYNLPGVQSGLKLDAKTIADIYLGKVKTWDDAEIKALNAGVSLPSTAITVVHRSDSSGTTAGPPAAARSARWRWGCGWCRRTAVRNASARRCFVRWPRLSRSGHSRAVQQ